MNTSSAKIASLGIIIKELHGSVLFVNDADSFGRWRDRARYNKGSVHLVNGF